MMHHCVLHLLSWFPKLLMFFRSAFGFLTRKRASSDWKPQLEAFQTISAFFVHDLKNAASTLKLTLQNLPVHFDDPAFRQDTLRSMGATTSRINQIIERLGALGSKLELRPSPVDLNRVVEQAIESVNRTPGIELAQELQPLPRFMADGDQLRSVVTNLLLNARDAVGESGRIEV